MWQDAKALNATANGLFALALLACIAAGVWWVSQRPMFNLRTIRIETSGGRQVNHGRVELSEHQIRDAEDCERLPAARVGSRHSSHPFVGGPKHG